jgi:hypothetical protein
MNKQTLFVILGLVIMVFIFACAEDGLSPARTLGDLVAWFFSTFPKN